MSPTGPGTPRNGSLSPCRCISCLHMSSAELSVSENGAVAAVVLGLGTHLGHQALRASTSQGLLAPSHCHGHLAAPQEPAMKSGPMEI